MGPWRPCVLERAASQLALPAFGWHQGCQHTSPMKTIRRWLFASLGLLFAVHGFALGEKSAGSPEFAAEAALSWLKLVDNYEYGRSWEEAGKSFRESATQERWINAMNRARKPLGRAASRNLLDSKFSTEAPRAPRGEYWIVRFETMFEGAKAHEIISLAQDADGAWRVRGFFIRPPS